MVPCGAQRMSSHNPFGVDSCETTLRAVSVPPVGEQGGAEHHFNVPVHFGTLGWAVQACGSGLAFHRKLYFIFLIQRQSCTSSLSHFANVNDLGQIPICLALDTLEQALEAQHPSRSRQRVTTRRSRTVPQLLVGTHTHPFRTKRDVCGAQMAPLVKRYVRVRKRYG